MRFGLLVALLALLAAHAASVAGTRLSSKPQQAQALPGSQKCDDSSFNGDVDLVITWHTNGPQSPPESAAQLKHFSHLLHGVPDTFLQMGAGIENQREIMYLLRGAERFGLLSRTRMVYVIVAKSELESNGPPRDLNWEHPQLRLVSDDEIGISAAAEGFTSKFASVQNIPGIGEWILVLHDDAIPTKAWDPAGVYDFQAKKPLVRLGADPFVRGWCGDLPWQSPMEHGPWFVSRCHLQELEARYPDRYKKVRTQNKHTKYNAALDVQCLYDNTAAREGWSRQAVNHDFWLPCHLNAACPGKFCCTVADFTDSQTLFMNLQGPGVSDDYPKDEKVHRAALKWFHTEYATPSRFEKKA